MEGDFDDVAVGFLRVFDFFPGLELIDGEPAFPVVEGGLVVVEDFTDGLGDEKGGCFEGLCARIFDDLYA